MDEQTRSAAVSRVLWVTLFLNVGVAALKLIYGYSFSIVSLQADGFHSVFDGLSNVIALTAIGLAKRPPDPEHPYGHRKFEVAASIVIGLMVILGMIEVARGVYDAATQGHSPQIESSAYFVVFAALGVNLFVSIYEHRAGKRLRSMVLQSDAKHTLSDALATLAVLGGIYLLDVGIPSGDVVAAIVVMTFIGMTAYRVLKTSLDVLVDTALMNPKHVQTIVEGHPQVHSCHFVRSRGMAGDIFLEFHMSMAPEITLKEAGEVMLEVKSQLKKEFPDLSDVLIQLEPHVPHHVDDVPKSLI